MTPNVVAEMTVALRVNLSGFIVESRQTEISDQLSPAAEISQFQYYNVVQREREGERAVSLRKVPQTEPSNL